MKIAILSDIHDHIWNLDKAKTLIRIEGCKAVIFCGDMCAPFTVGLLTQTKLPTYAVWGNVDEDHWAMVKSGGENFFAAPLAQEFNEVELDGRKIAFCHYPRLGSLLAETNYYDAVFHGHTHLTYAKKVAKTLLANPGAVCGIVQGSAGLASFMFYDTVTNDVQLIRIN
ncbi:MAG: phosphodiesterase, MJ0936 family protein [uncultured bacterium]|nr:MAG: phosphodiesterase, MJ0936 family protein [uncultured bacterium]